VIRAVSAEQDAFVAHAVDDVAGEGGCGFTVFGELDAKEQTGAADFTDEVVCALEFFEAVEKVVTDGECVRLQLFFLDHFEHG